VGDIMVVDVVKVDEVVAVVDILKVVPRLSC
jgi:hypothetical protein